MNTNEITKFFKKNKKQILIAVGVILAVIFVWIIIKRMRRNAITQKEAVEILTGQQVTLGINFDDLAKRMFTAWISSIGTDENEVYSILEQMNNQADWEYLKERYAAYWDSMPVYERVIHTTVGLGLSGMLVSDFRRELNNRELQRCRNILISKNINPGF